MNENIFLNPADQKISDMLEWLSKHVTGMGLDKKNIKIIVAAGEAKFSKSREAFTIANTIAAVSGAAVAGAKHGKFVVPIYSGKPHISGKQ